jgi:predicted TIM-barrel fold metal-dependent hydrolase
MSTKPHRIDVHHHIVPSEYVEALQGIGITNPGGMPFPKWEPKSSIETMDQNGISAAFLSISAPGVFFGDNNFTCDLARRCNEILARLVNDCPDRFGAFAVLPLPDVDGALKELDYALDTLKLDGVGLLTSIGEQYLGDPEFDPLFEELNNRKIVVYTHPNIPPDSDRAKLNIPAAIVDFIFDTTRAATNMIYQGLLERFPDIPFILSHAGGAVPYLAGRLSLADSYPIFREIAPKGVINYLKQFYYDTALSANKFALHSLNELVDSSHILFGTDYPFAAGQITEETINGINSYSGFSAQTRSAVERDNAFNLFPRLKQIIKPG